MKTRVLKNMFVFLLSLLSLPMMAQDWMEIHFKDGKYRRFFMKNVIEMVASNTDAEGIQHDNYEYQCVVTDYDVFTYLISDVDSIAFTKYDEETARHNFVDAIKGAFQVIRDNPILKDVLEHIEEIKNADGVEDAWSDGHELFVKIKGFGVMPFHFDHRSNYSIDGEGNIFDSIVMNRMKDLIPPAKSNMLLEGKHLKAVIANQTHFDKRQHYVKQRQVLYSSLLKWFRQNGIDAYYNEKPTIDFFYDNSSNLENDPNIYDFDIILLDTHGGYDETTGIHSFMTGEVLGEIDNTETNNSKYDDIWYNYCNLINKYSGATRNDIDLDAHLIIGMFENESGNGVEWTNKLVFYPVLKEDFFKYRASGTFKNPHSIFFNGACMSLKGNEMHTSYSDNNIVLSNYSLANIFLEKNLGTYLGYNELTSNSPYAGTSLYYSMLNGYSLDKAAYALPEIVKAEQQEDNYEGYGDYCLSSYLMRVPDISNKNAGNVFMVSTYTEEANQEKVNQEYSQNQTVTLEGITSHFLAEVEGLKYGFKYKAFDFGHNPLEFWSPIEQPWLDETDIEAELMPMTIDSEKGNRLFKAQLTNIEPNRTYYYRAYTYDGLNYNYGEPYSFKIDKLNPVPTDIPAEPIDLGLPSGTKWASCNVGATKPEEYGGYYAWGETEEKDVYDWSTYIHCDGSWDTCHDLGSDICGTEYDVAYVKWSSKWCMPTEEDIKELLYNCTTEWIALNGVEGMKFTSNINGNSIFLADGCYWSSSFYDSYYAGALYLGSSDDDGGWWDIGSCDLTAGLSIRPVMHFVSPKTVSLKAGETTTVEITFGSGNYAAWSNDDDVAIASVSNNATVRIKGMSVGSTTITVADMESELTATISVTVYFVSKEKVSLKVGEISTVEIGSGNSYTVESDNEAVAIARVYDNATVRISGMSVGTAKITVIDTRNELTATIAVTVMNFVSKENVSLKVGETTNVEITTSSGSYIAESDDEAVAIARVYDDATVRIKGMSVGTATITVTNTQSELTANITVTVMGAIDLGLPSGTKWASCNVGATKPEEYGDYYAWGETEEKYFYNENTYKFYQNGSYVSLGDDISGTEYDVAHVKWGGDWVMPTNDDINELFDNCTRGWTTLNGVVGMKFTSKINGNSIFLPAAGYHKSYYVEDTGSYGYYWSSTQNPVSSPNVYGFNFAYFYSSGVRRGSWGRILGLSVRPVVRN